MKSSKEIMDDIFSKYEKPLYYCWNNGKLSWDKPEGIGILVSELYEPPHTNKICDIEIGSLVVSKTSSYNGFHGQVTMIWPSINRIECQNGRNLRGNSYGGSLDILPDLKVLVTGSQIKEMYGILQS